MAQHVLIIILVQFTPQAIETISWKFFLIFVIATGIFAIVFILFYPETRNKTLEEMEGVFGDKVSTHHTSSLIMTLKLCVNNRSLRHLMRLHVNWMTSKLHQVEKL